MESIVFKAMGTTISLQIQHEFADYLLKEAKKRLLDYEKRFSANNDNSVLMNVNKLAGIESVVVDSDIYELIKIGKGYSLDASNTLNIAIGPLIKLWKIGFQGANVPTQSDIEECLKLIDPQSIILSEENQSIYLEKKGMEIDLGALAKGFFADKIKLFLKQAGVEKGIIDLGGNVLLIGSHYVNSDGYWRIGIQDPFKSRQNIKGLVKAKDVSVVTSGIYERVLVLNGQEYHHIFDSQTGYPVRNDIASVTIISSESLAGELYTTMFYQYKSSETINLINNIKGIEAIVITRDNDILMTDGLENTFVLVN